MKIYVQSFSWSKELFGSTMIIFCFICFLIQRGGRSKVLQREETKFPHSSKSLTISRNETIFSQSLEVKSQILPISNKYKNYWREIKKKGKRVTVGMVQCREIVADGQNGTEPIDFWCAIALQHWVQEPLWALTCLTDLDKLHKVSLLAGIMSYQVKPLPTNLLGGKCSIQMQVAKGKKKNCKVESKLVIKDLILCVLSWV